MAKKRKTNEEVVVTDVEQPINEVVDLDNKDSNPPLKEEVVIETKETTLNEVVDLDSKEDKLITEDEGKNHQQRFINNIFSV